MMQAGDLKHRAVFLYDASDGTDKPNWQPLFDIERNGIIEHWIPAAKKGLTGRLFYAAAAAQSENDVILTVRYSAEKMQKIRPTVRVMLDSDIEPYEVTADPVDVSDRRQWLEIHIRRITPNGR